MNQCCNTVMNERISQERHTPGTLAGGEEHINYYLRG